MTPATDPTQLPYKIELMAPGAASPAFDASRLGIEVTEPALAALCGLGNIDPQHGQDANWASPAAIEACLGTELPPPGTTLATVSADLDALGAMALLCLRKAGILPDDGLVRRVERVAAMDRYDRGPWPGPRPVPDQLEAFADDWPGEDLAQLSACARDDDRPLEDRVVAIAGWLSSGNAPQGYSSAGLARRTKLLRSLQLGATRVNLDSNGKIAQVVSLEPSALELGYRLSDLVIALNPAFKFPSGEIGNKFTIARWHISKGDLHEIARRLSSLEPGWGGQACIKGSPQSLPSRLNLDTVTRIVQTCLDH